MNTLKHVKGQVEGAGHVRGGFIIVGLLATVAVFLQTGMVGILDIPSEGVPDQALVQVEPEPEVSAESLQNRVLANYLSKRYRVAVDAAEPLVGVAFSVGRQVGLDPLLILAVMAVESRFNPFAQGEGGATGLMQIIPGMHRDKVPQGNEFSMLDPTTNVLVGSRILKEYIRRTGSLESGLQFYNGALWDTTSQYAQKVMAVQQRLRQAAKGTERPAPKSPSA